MLDSEAILYYADHPVEFVEDVIGANPTHNKQRYSAALERTSSQP